MVGLKIPLGEAGLGSVLSRGVLPQENSLSIVKPEGILFLATASKETGRWFRRWGPEGAGRRQCLLTFRWMSSARHPNSLLFPVC